VEDLNSLHTEFLFDFISNITASLYCDSSQHNTILPLLAVAFLISSQKNTPFTLLYFLIGIRPPVEQNCILYRITWNTGKRKLAEN